MRFISFEKLFFGSHQNPKKKFFPQKMQELKKNRVYFNRVCVLVLSLSLQWRHGQFATFAVFLFKSKPEVIFLADGGEREIEETIGVEEMSILVQTNRIIKLYVAR